MTSPGAVKESHLAGRWYPAAADALGRLVRELLDESGPPRADVRGILVPHAALAASGRVAARGFAAAGVSHRRAVVLAPSHHVSFRGAAVLPWSGYRTPLGLVAIDQDTVERLVASPLVRANPAVFLREHALEVQLPLLQVANPTCALVPVLIGELADDDADALAAVVAPLLSVDTLLVVSSNLVHYGRRYQYLPVPPTDAASVAAAVEEIDRGALARVIARDAAGFVAHVAETGATICGRGAIDVALRALPPDTRGHELAYATSLSATADHEHTVSYAAVAFTAAAA